MNANFLVLILLIILLLILRLLFNLKKEERINL
jgi:hypothetical protein